MTQVEQRILDKIRLKGTRLAEWEVSINYGIKTGLNDAFIVDRATRDRLIAEDPRSEEILKPVLRGRDIRRFKATWAERYLVATHNGYDDTPPVDPDDYPAVKRHLQGYQPRLGSRYDQGRTPYNLRNCAYQAEFTKEKLLWIELADRGRFCHDSRGFYGEATTFLLTGKELKYLCAVLNSRLITWFLRQAAPTSGAGTLRWKKVYIQEIPIPMLGRSEQRPLVTLVDKILKAKSEMPTADTSPLELETDRMVYELYDLTPEEIRAVEARQLYQR